VVLLANAKEELLEKSYTALDSLISPAAGINMIRKHGFGHSNILAFEDIPSEDLAAVGLSFDPQALLSQLIAARRGMCRLDDACAKLEACQNDPVCRS
jgi:hypothetical protein